MGKEGDKVNAFKWVGIIIALLILLMIWKGPLIWQIIVDANHWTVCYATRADYQEQLALQTFPTEYSEILEEYGEPIRIENGIDEGGMPYFIAYHETLIAECTAGWKFINHEVVILDPPIEEYSVVGIKILPGGTDYRFGRGKIGIGSPRWKVKWFYRNNMRIDLRNTPLAAYDEYVDGGGLYVAFHYDDDNRVDEILIYADQITDPRMMAGKSEDRR